MIDELLPYPEYQPSGSPWLGAVPSHWVVRSLGSITSAISRRSRPDLPLLSVVREKGVIPRSTMSREENHNYVPDDLSNYKVVRAGNLVINKMKAWQGSLGVAPIDGIVSPAYYVFDLDIEDRQFGQALLRSRTYVDFFARVSDGVRIGQWDLSINGMRRIPVPIPPPDEQAAIVRFLDHADRRIRRYIRAKQKLIKLLQEQQQAILHQAVTRGLDPSVPTRDSDLPWVPRVPSHWSLTPNHASLRIRKVLVGTRHTEFQLLSLTKRGVIVRDLSENKGKFSADLGTSQEVRAGDLVFCLFDVPETPRTVGLSPHHGMITGAYTVLECRDPSIARFIEAFYIAMDDRKLLSPLYSGLRNTIPKDRLLGARTPLPDDAERAAILDHIASTSAISDAAIDRARREIDLLRELRTRLVADVVTGQVDVRKAAARLSDSPNGSVDAFDEEDDRVDEDGENDLDDSIDTNDEKTSE